MSLPNDQEILKRIREIRMEFLRRSTSELQGSYHSAFRGQGMEFSEIRRYFPGDDVRNISWNTTARNRKLFVKDFKEDRSLNLVLAVDISPSMAFWSKVSRRVFIAEAGASLTYSALKVGDKVGALFFDNEIVRFLPPVTRLKNLLVSVGLTLSLQGKGAADLVKVEDFLERSLHETSAIFLFSDFFMDEKQLATSASVLRRLHVRHQVVPVMVHDPLELDLPHLGILHVRDMESGRAKQLHLSPRLMKKYRQKMEEHTKLVATLFGRQGMDVLHLKAGDDYVRLFTLYFKRNKKA
ncbi:MAG TPA: DUF58 domain-containing protein [Thermotogota bacterium]|nr:DUF58 domain-containing protein [Thermotogota bacterium]HRW92089.1 DUF58 domain-containing protein [Thermotogota bacterium]